MKKRFKLMLRHKIGIIMLLAGVMVGTSSLWAHGRLSSSLFIAGMVLAGAGFAITWPDQFIWPF